MCVAFPQSTSPHIQHLLVKAMSDWYLESDTIDPSKILSILEMAKELKVLPIVLTANNFPFIIELACWAAKRDFLKLDKWFSDKIRDYKVGFYYMGACAGIHIMCRGFFAGVGKTEWHASRQLQGGQSLLAKS